MIFRESLRDNIQHRITVNQMRIVMQLSTQRLLIGMHSLTTFTTSVMITIMDSQQITRKLTIYISQRREKRIMTELVLLGLIGIGLFIFAIGFAVINEAYYAAPGHRLEAVFDFFKRMFEGG